MNLVSQHDRFPWSRPNAWPAAGYRRVGRPVLDPNSEHSRRGPRGRRSADTRKSYRRAEQHQSIYANLEHAQSGSPYLRHEPGVNVQRTLRGCLGAVLRRADGRALNPQLSSAHHEFSLSVATLQLDHYRQADGAGCFGCKRPRVQIAPARLEVPGQDLHS